MDVLVLNLRIHEVRKRVESNFNHLLAKVFSANIRREFLTLMDNMGNIESFYQSIKTF